MNKKQTIKKYAFTASAFVGLCAVLYLLWQNGAFLPRWIDWTCGLHTAQSGRYEISLQDKSVTVFCDSIPVWTSPKNIKVQAALSCDIDRDQCDELILLCWKTGRYGKNRPFWVEHDETKWSQHIFVYRYDRQAVRPKWMSSYIGQAVAEMSVLCDGSSNNHLLLTDPDGKTSSWLWDSWGFTREKTEVSFIAFGDNLIHEPIYRYGLHNGQNFGFLFENVRETVSQSDIAILNQETPLTDNPALYSDYPRFGTPAQVGQAVADAGFQIVTCATNHAMDLGAEGIRFTKDFFESRNVKCLGIQPKTQRDVSPYTIVEKNGIRFALLNYTYGTNGIPLPKDSPRMVHLLADEAAVRKELAAAKADSDFMIVFVHWGTEYAPEPDDFQEKWAQVFLSCKADVVVGTHSHALQPCELLRDEDGHEMLLYYSIGNFVSAQPQKTCIKGGMACFTVSRTASGCKITAYDLRPLSITRHKEGKYTVAPIAATDRPHAPHQ